MFRDCRVATIILARAGSRRLPGKAMLPFGEGSVLSTIIERLRACSHTDDLVLATTECTGDDNLVRAAEALGVAVVRGSEEDLVGRMLHAVAELEEKPDLLVLAYADNPLVMPTIVDEALRELVQTRSDLVTPFEYATLPPGYGLTCLTRHCLDHIDRLAREPGQRESVEQVCFEHPEEFRIRYQVAPRELDYPDLCLTLDYLVDYNRLTRFEEILRGIDLAEQPRALIDHVRSARVWIEGVNEDEPAGHDLVVATEIPAGLSAAATSCGIVVVDTVETEGIERYALRYHESCGMGYPRGPLFLDRRALRSSDTPQSFLAHALPVVLPTLLGAPVRPVEGDAVPAILPARVAIELAEHYPREELLERLIEELAATGTELVVDASERESVVERFRAQLGDEYVIRGAKRRPLSEIVFDADGKLTVGETETYYIDSSVAAFWCSRSVRRARVEARNAETQCG